MARDLYRLMHSLFLPALQEPASGEWCPPADVYRTPDGWLLKLELPGVRPEDLRLSFAGNRICVAGRRRDEEACRGARHHHLEIAYGRFERHFELPCDITRCGITTEFRDGMLHIQLRTERES